MQTPFNNALKGATPFNKTIMSLQQESDPEAISLMTKTVAGLTSLLQAIRSIRIDLPKLYRIEGSVSVVNLPPVEIRNFSDLRPYFEGVAKSISSLQLGLMQLGDSFKSATKDKKDLPSTLSINKFDSLLTTMNDMRDELVKGFNLLINQEKTEFDNKSPMPVEILNFPPQMIPTPVTNVWLNALNGFINTTATTVTTSRTVLPGYGNLFDRRALQIYNNDSSATLYIGGSNVTTTNGLPVPPLSFSPSIDAGYKMQVYGVSTTSINVRVIEVSKSQAGVEYN